jgi:tetratricopeptide (TPR) repeat protein
MKSKRREQPPKTAAAPVWTFRWWHAAAGGLVALVAGLIVYGPALNGPFVFDDQYLPFFSPHFAEQPMLLAIRGVRPFLMFTFWVNSHMAGTQPYLYHLFNLLFHVVNSLLVFLIARKLISWAGSEGRVRDGLAAFAGALFLLHPVQTESVSYVASRSENLSALLLFGAIAVFVLRRRMAVSWPVSLAILILYGAAVSTKEHTVVLPAILLLIDYFWNPGFSLVGIRRNWKLYAPLLAGGALAAWSVAPLLSSPTAGFSVKGLPWYDYFYTQWRALWIYFRLFVLPFGQSADYNYPIVRTPFDPWALAGLAGLLILLASAVYFRKRYPLACFGFLAALVLLAPTSSVVPIADAVTERRLYLPMLGLVLVVVELLRQWRARRHVVVGTAVAVLVVLSFLCFQRNQVWASDVTLWEDAVAKSPRNWRAHFQLGVAYLEQRRCDVAAREYEIAAGLGKPDYRLYVDWANSENCLNRPEEALEKLRLAVGIERRAVAFSEMALIYGKLGNDAEAFAAIATALELNPQDDLAYFYRGNLRVRSGDLAGAAADYGRAIEINPDNEQARRGLMRVQSRAQTQ